MRTMLILIFLCSLAQFVESGGTKPDGCGTTYNCYAPHMCTYISKYATVPVSKVVEVDNDNTDEGCPAIIKFYLYAKYWLYVSIEGLVPATKSIEFRTTNSAGAEKSYFKCENVAGKAHRTYLTETKVDDIDIGSLLKCTFNIKLKIEDDIFKTENNDKTYMIIDSEKTLVKNLPINILKCDPSDLIHESKYVKKTKVYKPVKFNAGKFSCEDKYKMEFRRYGSDTYDDATTDLTCEDNEFKIKDEKFENYWMYIRCYALAKFFCNYETKTPTGKDALKLNRPDLATSKEGSLKCPDDYPHLYIDKLPPITNPTIECHNYGGQQYWTVTANKAILTANGPLVYCSKKLDCSVNNRISAKSIQNGYLALQNSSFTPKCYDGGILTVDGKQITNVFCDYSTGEFKYNENVVVTPDTSFICTYKPQPNAKENARNKEKMNNGLAIVIGTCVGGFFLGIIIVVAVIKINSAMTRRRINREADEHYVNFLMNEKERDIFREKNKAKPATKKNQPIHWSEFLMHRQYFNEKDILAKPALPQTAPMPQKPVNLTKYGGKSGKGEEQYARSGSAALSFLVKRYMDDYANKAIEDKAALKLKNEQRKAEMAKKAASKSSSK